jgi:hypothetical protein
VSSFGTYGGLQIFVSSHCTEEVCRFPDKKRTKRRMRRVIGKYGSWKVRRPAAYRAGPALYVHPVIYDQMRRELAENGRTKQP